MAIGIGSTASGVGGFGLEAQRAALSARRREATEAREEPTPDSFSRRVEAEPLSAQRISEVAPAREARPERIRLSQVVDEAVRPGIAAYLNVKNGTLTDPSYGELLGIDIYV